MSLLFTPSIWLLLVDSLADWKDVLPGMLDESPIPDQFAK
jgi:hypothetical protein